MKKLTFFLLAVMAVMLVSCKGNEPDGGNQTYKMGNLTFSYYLSESKTNTNTYAPGELLIVHLDVQNGGVDTVMINADYLGSCYNKNQLMESMSTYITNDSFPVFKPTYRGTTARFSYVFSIDVASDSYYYKNPHIYYYKKGNEGDIKNIMIPLTINFNVQ